MHFSNLCSSAIAIYLLLLGHREEDEGELNNVSNDLGLQVQDGMICLQPRMMMWAALFCVFNIDSGGFTWHEINQMWAAVKEL